jgi:predicted transglutaminase-like cysteine proteinase
VPAPGRIVGTVYAPETTVKARVPAIFLTASAILLAAGCASQSDLSDRMYAFDRQDEFLTTAHNYDTWSQLLAAQAAERPVIDACLVDEAQCPRHLRGYRVVVERASAHPPERQIRIVNFFINQRRWRDKPRSEGWQTLGTFFRRGGQCEDVALAKYFTLRDLGFSADDLRVVIAWDPTNRAYHAVLAVNLDEEVHLLDVDNSILTGFSHRTYQFLYSLNEDGVWDHGRI